jgi:hypothetical protein
VESAPLPPIDEGPPLERFEPTSEDKNLAMFCHLGGWLTGFLVPLIIWLIQKDKSRFVDDQGKEALNFQLTLLIAYAVSVPLMLVCVGVFLFLGGLDFRPGGLHHGDRCGQQGRALPLSPVHSLHQVNPAGPAGLLTSATLTFCPEHG